MLIAQVRTTMTKHDNERLKRLEKRLNWLNTRLYQAGDKDLTFDKAEASALEWAIDIIEKYLKVKPDEPQECKHLWSLAHFDKKELAPLLLLFCQKCPAVTLRSVPEQAL